MVSLIEESGDKLENCLSILVKQVAKLVVTSPVEVTEDNLAEELEVSDIQSQKHGSMVLMSRKDGLELIELSSIYMS